MIQERLPKCRALGLVLMLAMASAGTALAKESTPTSPFWEVADDHGNPAIVVTVVVNDRPVALLTVVPEIDMGSVRAVEDVAMNRVAVRDRFLLGLVAYASSKVDPRAPLNIPEIKQVLQVELDKILGAKKGTVYITSAHIAGRKN